MTEPIRILLGPGASAALTARGGSCFLVIGKASWPDDPSRWVIHAIPCDLKAASAACRVARGISRESKPRGAKP